MSELADELASGNVIFGVVAPSGILPSKNMEKDNSQACRNSQTSWLQAALRQGIYSERNGFPFSILNLQGFSGFSAE